ncbi:hypothetical protein NQ176_g7548 [Zarea fungicola]|uniref:Uncharacterized protein n=1 Tax=Zarea fungicola TaxID=93591 RepID=A0ACC1MZV5_9HYPO|nr:hypothetical protein NQ176_g7548 [Lecanicillium fungicola]
MATYITHVVTEHQPDAIVILTSQPHPLTARTDSNAQGLFLFRSFSLQSTITAVPDLDNDVDKHKLDSIRKQQSGTGHWKRELASDSEEAIKADKGQQSGAKESVEALQERTKRAAEETNRSGTSHQEGM